MSTKAYRGRGKSHLLLIIILSLYVLLAALYGLFNPLFEAPDEHHHFFTARFMGETKTVPLVTTAGPLIRQEAAQPPLYYILTAPLAALVDTSGAEGQLWFNPEVSLGVPQPANINSFVHTERESWPWQGYALAAHLMRFLSTMIGLGTLICIYGSGRLIWPASPDVALLATALVAFLPQFGFLHGTITNDVLIIFLASAVLWQLLWIWFNQTTTARLLLLGVTIGLAVLTKMAGLLLLLPALPVLALMVWRDRQALNETGGEKGSGGWRRLLRLAALVIVPALLVSGWLLWRNWINYGDITAANQFVALAGGDRHYSLRQVWHDLDRVAKSAVAFFGWMNVEAPGRLYLIWGGILLLAGGGWLYAVWQKRQAPGDSTNKSADGGTYRWLIAVWMGAWLLLVGGAWLRFMMQTPADQGRLLFPALLPVALAVARGLTLWRRRRLSWLVAVAALFTSVYALLVMIPSAYHTAEIVTDNEIPSGAARRGLDMGYGIELVAVERLTEELRPGEWAWVDLYWRAAEATQEAPFVRMGLYGRDNALVGGPTKQYHGSGNYPASLWPAGQIVKESVGVQLSHNAELPAQLRLLLRIDEAREQVEIARMKAIPAQWPETNHAPLAALGDEIELISVSTSPAKIMPGSTVALAVQWRVRNAPGRELTTFVHLGDPAQAPLAQGDAPALNGEYPTNLWAAGEVIADHYTLAIPDDLAAGSYPLRIGFYEPQSGMRLPVQVSGQAQEQDAYFIGLLNIEAE